MDSTGSSIPETSYTDEETAALASGVTPEELAYRRLFSQKKTDANETLWTPINPRGIITIPKALPLGVRQLVSLVLLLCYPFWLVLFFCILVIGRTLYAGLWLLFLPLAMWQKRNHPDEYAAAKSKKVKRDVFLSALPSPGESPEGQDK